MNAVFVFCAGAVAIFPTNQPGWATAQRWLMAKVLDGLAVRLATEARR